MCNKSKEGEGKENSLSQGGRWKRSGIKLRDLFHNCIQQRGIVEEWLQLMPIDLEAFSYGLTFDFNCPIRINISNNKRSNPFRTKLTTHEFVPKIIHQNLLPDHEVLPSYQAVMEFLGFLLVELRILIGFQTNLIQFTKLQLSFLSNLINREVAGLHSLVCSMLYL